MTRAAGPATAKKLLIIPDGLLTFSSSIREHYQHGKKSLKRCLAGAASEASQKKKKTCGSTVFSPGHPRQYSLAPAMLNFADRTRRGVFIAVWPQITHLFFKCQYKPLFPLSVYCKMYRYMRHMLWQCTRTCLRKGVERKDCRVLA